MMKRTLLFAWWMLALCGALRADELAWETDYAKAIETAKAQHKPVLLDFAASWCGPCRMMETTTFANDGVQDKLAHYVLVKVDFDQSAGLVGKYGVNAIPACFVLNQFGERVAEHVGYVSAEDFLRWMAQNAVAAFAEVSKNQPVVDRVKGLGGALESTDVQVRDKAAADLLNVYCAKDATDDGVGAKIAVEQLRGFVQRNPAAALAYLDDRRLAVRILLAGLLAEKIGADFQFDPWEQSDARAAAVAGWVKKLAVPNL